MESFEESMDKNIRISELFDYYGDMLTEKQRNFIGLYYNEDFSLAEIAEHESISRQGVRDSIKHGEQYLLELEEKLGIARKAKVYYEMCDRIRFLAHEIHRQCGRNPSGVKAAEIELLITQNKELL